MSFFSEKELKKMGFYYIGANNKIHKSVCFDNINNISIGDNVEIKAFCVIRGNITIHDKVSIGEYSYISAMHNSILLKERTIIYQNVVVDADKLKDKDTLIIGEGIKIECHCIVTKGINNKKAVRIPFLSII